MSSSNRLLIVIATYNEIENLPILVEQLSLEYPFANIMIIDDNSPDGTGDWAASAMESSPLISVIHRDEKMGLGSATKLGFHSALRDGSTMVATMDADLSHDPKVLRTMLSAMEENKGLDVVIGSRYVPGGKILGWPWYRRLSSYLVNGFARLVLGLKTRDNTSAFRLYRVEKLREINIDAIQSQGYSYLEEILVMLKKSDARFAEVPIVFQNRELGRSKVDFGELCRSMLQILRLSLNR